MVDAPWTMPIAGGDHVAVARSRFLRIAARRLLAWPDPLPAWLDHAMAGVRGPLATLLKAQPGALYGALALPQVNAPLFGGDLAAAVPQLLLELARRKVLPPEGVWWHGPVRQLVSPILNAAPAFSPPRVGMLFGNGWVELGKSDTWALGPRAPAFHALGDGGWLAEADTNPLAMVEAHPDKAGNTMDLGGRSAAEWVAAIDEARGMVRAADPTLADEHRGLLATIHPVGAHAEISSSASYKEAIGQIYLSLHPNPVTMAEAIVHETQHNKLNMLAWSDAIVRNGDERYRSPVRPDPRPMWGVVLAVHAFLPVALLHRTWIEQGQPYANPTRFQQVLQVNHDGMEVLRAHAQPTELGAAFIAGLDQLEAALWPLRS